MRYLLGLALLLGAAAQSAPVPNLVLTCSDENAIGQNACHGIWAYQIPTNPLIVSTGSYGIWRVLGDLIGADTVVVCTLPVEPGQYSSCRDASGVRRTAYARKDSIIAMNGGSVTVDKTGADYTDPVTAAQNAFAGDTWCVAPQWPSQPCVMAIGEGVFILGQTLSIPQGLAVSGAGKGATLLVADNGVETAVSSFGNVRISDLTIVNSQPISGAHTTGLYTDGPVGARALTELHGVAIHVSGAGQNVAVTQNSSLEILDSEITAVGQDSWGIALRAGYVLPPVFMQGQSDFTLERSHVAAENALSQPYNELDRRASVRLVDSDLSGSIKSSVLDIARTEIVGNLTANSDRVSVVVTDSSIKGDVDVNALLIGSSEIRFDNTNVEGRLTTPSFASFRGLILRGEFFVQQASLAASVIDSYIINPGTAAPVITLTQGLVELQRTFVQGAIAGAGSLSASSSVLAGTLSVSIAGTCSDTYGADYELLNAACQREAP